MPWTADVPFPAEDLSRCRGCNATIGWVRREDPTTGEKKAHPVDPRGWHGAPCGEATFGCRKGYTADGDRAAVIPFPEGQLFPPTGTVVFTSHFVTCPDAERFRQRKAQERRGA